MSSSDAVSCPVFGSGSSFSGCLTSTPRIGFLKHQVEGDVGVEGVLGSRGRGARIVLLGQVDRAVESFVDQRRVEVQGADL